MVRTMVSCSAPSSVTTCTVAAKLFVAGGSTRSSCTGVTILHVSRIPGSPRKRSKSAQPKEPWRSMAEARKGMENCPSTRVSGFWRFSSGSATRIIPAAGSPICTDCTPPHSSPAGTPAAARSSAMPSIAAWE